MNVTRALNRRIGLVALVLGTVAAGCASGTDASRTTSTTPPSAVSTTPEAAPPPIGGFSELPEPGGPFAVGVGELGVAGAVVWYPAADGPDATLRPYLDGPTAELVGVDPTINSRIATHGHIDADPLDGDPRPVVVVLPGFGSPVEASTSLAEHLASTGIVVVTVPVDIAAEVDTDVPTTQDRDARYAAARLVIDAVHDGTVARIAGPVDPSRVAVGGHSFGGSNAFNLGLADPRIGAVFNLDGRLFDAAAVTPFPGPALFVMTVDSAAAGASTHPTLLRDAPDTVALALVGATHLDFTDAPAIASTLGSLVDGLQLGPIGAHATTVVNRVVGTFLSAVFSASPHDAASLAAIDPALLPVADDWTVEAAPPTQ